MSSGFDIFFGGGRGGAKNSVESRFKPIVSTFGEKSDRKNY
jgi:hypothetical protein